MEQRLCDQLAAAGICAGSLLERLMNNEMLVSRFLKRFLEDETYQALAEAFERGDAQEALVQAHTLKGTCGNLSMQVLYELLDRQVQCLRKGDWQEAKALMPAVAQAYQRVEMCIRREFA